MPGRNGTGPAGCGSLTGRGMGPCGGAMAHGGRYSRRNMCGFGRNFGHMDYLSHQPTASKEQKELLRERKEYLESELEDLQKRLNEL